MKTTALSLLLSLTYVLGFAQVTNSSCGTAKALLAQPNDFNYCSTDAEHTTVGSTSGQVWFKFIASRSDVNITVVGKMNGSTATLLAPSISLYQGCSNSIYSSVTHAGNLTTLYKGGLVIGESYSFMVSGNNTGTFKLCINNYTPILQAGQDCGTASFLCNKQTFTQTNVSGAGTNPNEATGTCLASPGVNSEQNSVWYKWIAAKNGTLTFIITPSSRDDIDWVLFDLGTTNDCMKAAPANAIRCAAGRGVDCDPQTQHVYTPTGLSLTATDYSEASGCFGGQDGFVKYVDMLEGHIYSLLINNFDSSNHGFTIEFGGTSDFVGPSAKIDFVQNGPCQNQSYTFKSLSTNFSNLKWTLGEGASISTTTAEGPFDVSYSTSGTKTVVLEAFNDKGCSVIDTKIFNAIAKSRSSVITANQTSYCVGDTIRMSTTLQSNATYLWTGPNNFTSAEASIKIPVDVSSRAGVYSLVVTIDNCARDTSSYVIPPIPEKPIAGFIVETIAELPTSQTIQFLNTSINADHYLWNFGDGNTSEEANPVHTYTSTGIFDINLRIFNSGACSQTSAVAHSALAIEEGGTIHNHTIFTPNGDAINDEFVINTTNLKSYKIRIFDRYGTLLFVSSNISENWKGLYQNAPLAVGTYYYVIDGVGLNGKEVNKSGSVTILR